MGMSKLKNKNTDMIDIGSTVQDVSLLGDDITGVGEALGNSDKEVSDWENALIYAIS